MRKSPIPVILLACTASLTAADLKVVSLPAPQTDGGRPLMQLLKERKSTREFDSAKLPLDIMSNLLWAASGVNRPDGRRTSPTSTNRQEIDIYVATADGLYLYGVKEHQLQPVAAEDIRALTGNQDYVGTAPVNLVYVADFARMGEGAQESKLMTSGADTGFIGQNVYLYCASQGLATVIRGGIDRGPLAKAMHLRPDQRIVLAQTVGYPKK